MTPAAHGAVVAVVFGAESALGALAARISHRRTRTHYARFESEAAVPEQPPAAWDRPVEIGCCDRCRRLRPIDAGRYIGCGHNPSEEAPDGAA